MTLGELYEKITIIRKGLNIQSFDAWHVKTVLKRDGQVVSLGVVCNGQLEYLDA